MNPNTNSRLTLRQRLADAIADSAHRYATRKVDRLIAKGRYEEAEAFTRSFVKGALVDRTPAVLNSMDALKAQHGGKVTW